jgi:hypothetical protein
MNNMKIEQVILFMTLLTLILIPACQTGQAAQDASDQRALRRLFGIPNDFKLLNYAGYPARVGFGQREGLEISGVFMLSDDQMTQFKHQIVRNNWQALPIEEDIRSKILWKNLPVPLEAQSGYYMCATAGDNVLYATRTKTCAETAPRSDIILGIIDLSTRQLHVVVRAGY